MADFAPPSNPPPPKVPEGYKAIWNEQYKEYFYVNIYTKKSQWDKPDTPVYPPGEAPLDSGPPAYHDTTAQPLGPEKSGLGPGAGGQSSLTEDERLARQLQDEENRRAGGQPYAPGPGPGGPIGSKGAADDFYNDPYAQQQAQQGLAPPPGQGMDGRYSPGPVSGERSEKRRSFLGKLFGSNKQHGQPQYGPQQGYYPPQGAPMGYPQQAGYGAGPYMQPGRPGRRPGMGAGGAAALGVGGGLLGGMMLGSALDGHDGMGHGSDWGYAGDDSGGYGAGDDGYAGNDGGGFGGDDGGGDFGGGDFGGGDGGGGD